MKVFSSVLAVLLASSVGLAGCSQSTTQEKPPEGQIRVLLPNVAEVAMKAGESKSGRLMGIEGKQLVIENSGSSAKLDIDKVEKVTFKGEIRYHSNGQIVIRGENENKKESTQQKELTNIPVEDFKLKEPKTGEANLTLPQSMSGLLAVAKDNHVVVKEMKFNPASGKMTITIRW